MATLTRKVKNLGHLVQAYAATVRYEFPAKKLVVIGVTGTDGKTTTSNLIYHILNKAGIKVAVISTIGATIDGVSYDTGFHVTTPSPFAIQKYLQIAQKRGCTHAILEVTSHALDQNRVKGVPFEYAVLTNVTQEHLDYHKNYDNYVTVKLKLLKLAKQVVVNSNGEWFDKIRKSIPKSKISTYSLHGVEEGDITLLNLPFEVKTSLIGDFNLENILAAVVVCQKIGIENNVISQAVESFQAPIGRQEIIEGMPAHIMVDFAHTANSFENILPEIRKKTKGKLIHVFGAAGERDRGKRAQMGKVAAFYDDVIILTAEDPRSESLVEINAQIKKGIGLSFSQEKKVYEIDNRKEAIEFALSQSEENDTVIITGKGHEVSINYGNGEEKWSDQEAVRDYIKLQKTT